MIMSWVTTNENVPKKVLRSISSKWRHQLTARQCGTFSVSKAAKKQGNCQKNYCSRYCLNGRPGAKRPVAEAGILHRKPLALARNKVCGPVGLAMCLYHFFKKWALRQNHFARIWYNLQFLLQRPAQNAIRAHPYIACLSLPLLRASGFDRFRQKHLFFLLWRNFSPDLFIWRDLAKSFPGFSLISARFSPDLAYMLLYGEIFFAV